MFAAPLGLLALLAIPAIVALHLFRRRFRPREVSALFLWLDADRTPLSGRKRERLRSSVSLWSECLAALCLALALAGLRGCGARPAEHLVAVLDASASMGARASDGTLAERAKRELRERIDELPRGSRVTLIESGAHPRVLAGPAAFPAEALERLERFTPRAQRHDLSSSIAFALQVAGGNSVLALTDTHDPERFAPEVELVSVGAPLDNVALTHASRRRVRSADARGTTDTVFLAVENLSPRPRTTRLSLETVDAPRAELTAPRELALEPREKRTLTFDLPAVAGPVVARLTEDALAIDDVAWLAPNPPRTLALATTLDDEGARRLGLSSGREGASRIDRWLAIVPDAIEAPAVDAAHVVVARGDAGGASTWTLALDARDGSERKDWIGPFLVEKRHPLLDGVTLDGVVWSADPALALEGAPLVSAGNVPLLTEDERGGRRIYHLDLDPARSTLARSPDWPILLANLAELRRLGLPGPERTNLAVGDALHFRCAVPDDSNARDEDAIVVEREDGAGEPRTWPARATLLLDGFDAPGMYRVKQKDRELARIAVRFNDAAESDLSKLGPGRRAAQGSRATLDAGASWVETVLLALAALAIAVDWWWLARAPGGANPASGETARGVDGLPAS